MPRFLIPLDRRALAAFPAAAEAPALAGCQQPTPAQAAGLHLGLSPGRSCPRQPPGRPAWPVAQQPIPEPNEPEGPFTFVGSPALLAVREVHAAWMLQDDAQRLWGRRSLFGEGLSLSYDALRVGQQSPRRTGPLLACNYGLDAV